MLRKNNTACFNIECLSKRFGGLSKITDKEYIDKQRERFGIWPKNKDKLKNAYGEFIDNPPLQDIYYDEDDLMYLYENQIVPIQDLKYLIWSNPNISLEFIDKIIEKTGLIPDFDVIFVWRHVSFEGLYNLLTKHSIVMPEYSMYFMKIKNPREKYFRSKLINMGYKFHLSKMSLNSLTAYEFVFIFNIYKDLYINTSQ